METKKLADGLVKIIPKRHKTNKTIAKTFRTHNLGKIFQKNKSMNF